MKGLILIYAVAGLGSIAALRAPIIGLFIYVGFAVLRPEGIWGWAGDLSGISLVVGLATLAGWVLHGFGSLRVGRGRVIVACLVLFFVWAAISAYSARDTSVAYDSLVQMAKFVMPFLIGVTLLETESHSRAMLWLIVLAQGYVGFEMNLAYLRGYNLAGEGFAGMDNNCFGVSLVSSVGPAIALGLGARKWYERLLCIIATGFIIHTTLLTFSRGAMVGLLVVGGMAFVIMPKRPKYLAAIALALLLAIRFTGPQLMERYASAFAESDQRDGSAESRLDLWRDCLRLAEEQPIFGVGPANFSVVASSIGWTEGKQAHSVWMQTLAETGFPGVTLLVLFFGLTVLKLWPIARMKQTEETRYQIAIATGIITSIVGFMVAGQFVSLAGLEIPYYMAMIGVVLLKLPQASTESVEPATPIKVTGLPRRPSFGLHPAPTVGRSFATAPPVRR
jgi:probable O-glycosylation ligase (exosortase A-associated)